MNAQKATRVFDLSVTGVIAGRGGRVGEIKNKQQSKQISVMQEKMTECLEVRRDPGNFFSIRFQKTLINASILTNPHMHTRFTHVI